MSELEDAEACNKELPVFSIELEIALLEHTLQHPARARNLIDQISTTLEGLIIQCQRNDVPCVFFEHLHGKLVDGNHDLMMSGIDGLATAMWAMELYPSKEHSNTKLGPTMYLGNKRDGCFVLLGVPVAQIHIESFKGISNHLDGTESFGTKPRPGGLHDVDSMDPGTGHNLLGRFLKRFRRDA